MLTDGGASLLGGQHSGNNSGKGRSAPLPPSYSLTLLYLGSHTTDSGRASRGHRDDRQLEPRTAKARIKVRYVRAGDLRTTFSVQWLGVGGWQEGWQQVAAFLAP